MPGTAATIVWMTVPDKPVRKPRAKRPVKPKPAEPPTRGELFDAWWPRVLQIGSFSFALIHVLLSQFGVGDVDPSVLGLCGLILAGSAVGGKRSE